MGAGLRRAILMIVLSLGAAAPAGAVTVTGCIAPLRAPQCVLLKTISGSYDIGNATPRPRPGQFGTVTGSYSRSLSRCGATVLRPARWSPQKWKTCPAM